MELKKTRKFRLWTNIFAGLINDVVIGFPLGISSFAYLFICGFAAYLRNITFKTECIKGLAIFLFAILVVNSLTYIMLILFFKFKIYYLDIVVNIVFTFFLYIIFANLFELYQRLIRGSEKND